MQVSTVDAFQGGERGIIILSCVRTQTAAFIDSDKYVYAHAPLCCVAELMFWQLFGRGYFVFAAERQLSFVGV